ncbi:hypothetical protein ElyMa_002695600 [Elysia marginata]|uniref:Uncharacterized protein n=1 Tax=Elysia marginata TaxID=1093978 RepID=A0AAV4HC49_9GAST|nr:hypothetical protein ElyMa_002695600 [Elysia marginata]
MRTFLACLLVAAVLGFAFAAPEIEKRQFDALAGKLADALDKVTDILNDPAFQQRLKDAQDKIKDAAGTVLDKVGDAADKLTGF